PSANVRLTPQLNDTTATTGNRSGRISFSDQKAIGLGERHHHGTVLNGEGRRYFAVCSSRQRRPQIIRALVIGGKVTAKQCRFDWSGKIAAPAHAADERQQKQESADIGRYR